MPPIHDEAVCLRHWEWSETSQTALLLSRGHGLVRVLAKGSRRPKASFSGGLEVLTVGAMQAILKPDGALALLTVWELRQPMLHLRTSLASWQHAQIAGEIAARMLSEQDPHPSVYDALVLLLSSLDSTRNTSASLLCFVWTTLCDCGYELELIHDVQTGAELDRADRYGFAPNLGGLTTDPGPDSASAFDQRNPIWRVRGETVSILQRLRGPKTTGNDGAIFASPNEATRNDLTPSFQRALKLLLSYIQYLIGFELVSARQTLL